MNATRWCEVRIGELLGKAEKGRPAKEKLVTTNLNGSTKIDRHHFRLLAQHKSLVGKLIDGGRKRINGKVAT